MNEKELFKPTTLEPNRTISARRQLLASLKDRHYRGAFVQEKVRSSVALQIRALRDQRDMTQQELGEKIGMAQTWISRLENPEYGKMTVATLLRLAEAFDTDLEIKFRSFSWMLKDLPRLTSDYFEVLSFDEEFDALSSEREEGASEIKESSARGREKIAQIAEYRLAKEREQEVSESTLGQTRPQATTSAIERLQPVGQTSSQLALDCAEDKSQRESIRWKSQR